MPDTGRSSMKFISYRASNAYGTGLDVDGQWIGLSQGDQYFPGMIGSLVASGSAAFDEAHDLLRRHGRRLDPQEVQLLMPIEARRIICVGLNYVDHARESGLPLPETPTLFSRFSSSLADPGAPIIRPSVSHELDFEGELAVVIGKAGRHLGADDALDHVAGYSCFNDGSIRDYQLRTPQWTIGKNFDRSGSFGPALVPSSALPPGASGLQIRTRLNGDVVQSSSTDQLIFDVASLVTHISVALTLQPGDVIATGTPSGAGFARVPPLWMKEGDICEVEIEGLGTLRNPVQAET